MAEKRYPEHLMLPGISYVRLEHADILESNVLNLEVQTKTNLAEFSELLRDTLQRAKMILTAELFTAHLCAYLGCYMMKALGPDHCNQLMPVVEDLISKEAQAVYRLFQKHKVRKEEDGKPNNSLEAFRIDSPGSLAAQTIRLGRIIHDALDELYYNRPCRRGRQKELFCPVDEFLPLLDKQTTSHIKAWKVDLRVIDPLHYTVNQAVLQTAWLMGYFSYMDKQGGPNRYIEIGTPIIKMYADFQFLKGSNDDPDRVAPDVRQKQFAIVESIDQALAKARESGCNVKELFAEIFTHIPDFKKLTDICSEDDLFQFSMQYEGFGCFMNTVCNLSQAYSKGKLPKNIFKR